jgi:hypothetical protein
MKRYTLAALLIVLSGSLWAQSPRRNVEFGLDSSAEFANSYLRPSDILQETIVLDFTAMSRDLRRGFGLFTGVTSNIFFNVNMVNFGFGWFAGVDGAGQFKIPQSLFELIAHGNTSDNYSGSFDIGAAAFAEAGGWFSAKIVKNLKLTVRPSYFLPLVYMTKSEAGYSLVTSSETGDMDAEGSLSAALYTPLPMNEDGSIDSGKLDVGSMLGKGGGDLSLGVEYSLFNNLILGASLTHIPIVPARISEGYNVRANFSYYQNVRDLLEDGKSDTETPEAGETGGESKKNGLDYEEPTFTSFSGSEQVIFRPVKLGFNAFYQPFNTRFFVLKPYAALVFNGIYDTPIYFDFGGIAELNLGNIFIIDAGTSFEDMIWKHSLGFVLNMRALELDIAVSTQSQNFLKSFQAAGLRINIGIRMGF